MNHTPGPWKVVASPNRWNVTTTYGPRTLNICAVNSDRMEQEANARLIAAAPLLLANLRIAVEILRLYGFDDHAMSARTAIAVALGEG